MHTWHCCKMVHKFTAHPYTLGIVTTDSVNETVLLGKQSGRHAGKQSEYCESEEVAECHCAADSGEDGVGGGRVVVPCDKATK